MTSLLWDRHGNCDYDAALWRHVRPITPIRTSLRSLFNPVDLATMTKCKMRIESMTIILIIIDPPTFPSARCVVQRR